VGVGVLGGGAEWRLEGSWPDVAVANLSLEHLRVRSFASATVRAYAYDVLCFARFCAERELRLAEVVPADLFDWVAWQAEGQRPAADNMVRLTRHAGAAPSSINRRVAAVRALFEHQVVLGARAENPVPAPRRGQGLRAKSRGVLGHLGPGRPRGGGRLVRAPQRLPEALDTEEVAANRQSGSSGTRSGRRPWRRIMPLSEANSKNRPKLGNALLTRTGPKYRDEGAHPGEVGEAPSPP
jgi:integrase/recombinase XerC